jgi:hypothetical protein
MHTAKSLKAEHKTLAAAKSAHSTKAKSWQALADKLNTPTIESLQQKIKELEARLAKDNAPEPFESAYFISPEAEIVYSIVELDGEERLKALGVNKLHFKDPEKAKKWRNDLAAKVHPDKCAHPYADKAMGQITALYKNMVA